MVVKKLEPLDLGGMAYGAQSLTGRALKNFDRLLISCPMINDPSSAFIGLLDGPLRASPCETSVGPSSPRHDAYATGLDMRPALSPVCVSNSCPLPLQDTSSRQPSITHIQSFSDASLPRKQKGE